MTSAKRGKKIRARLEKLNQFLQSHGHVPQPTVTRAERLVAILRTQIKEKQSEEKDKKAGKQKKSHRQRKKEKRATRKEASKEHKKSRDNRRKKNKLHQEKKRHV